MNLRCFVGLSLTLLLFVGGITGCGAMNAPAVALPTITPAVPTSTQPAPTSTLPPSPALVATSTSLPPSVWLDEALPDGFSSSLEFSAGTLPAESGALAQARVFVGTENVIANWVYALAAPFPTVTDGVSRDDLLQAWQGGQTGPFAGVPILMEKNTLLVFTALWGMPATGAIRLVPDGLLLDTAWKNRPSWALLSFESLEPRWKVLDVDGISPLRKSFVAPGYTLTVPISLVSLTGSDVSAPAFFSNLPNTNRDPQKLTVVALTGVTALVRATALTMRIKGILHPGEDVGPLLRDADITHISNEIPFWPDCPPPDPRQAELIFCSNPAYYDLLESIGMDVVELTGDHFGDFGPDAMRYTLDLYREKDIPYYGGGYSQEDALKPVLFEHNGNKIAFLGCNGKGGGYATARGENPGAVACDYTYIASELQQLKSEGYIPIFTFQHFEYYVYEPQPKLITDFRRVAESGAAIISGSQAHQPHGFEFYAGAFIHYGLGNLFFDQYHFDLPTDRAFIDLHVIYDGKYLGVDLVGIQFIDFARPRLMTPEERQDLLQAAFAASLWEPGDP